MSQITIHHMHTGRVYVPTLIPFGTDHGSRTPKAYHEALKDHIWLPVSVFLIEHPTHGKILIDTGWNRDMSPDGKNEKDAQIASLGNRILYKAGPADLPMGESALEKLAKLGISPSDLDYVILSHLDDDHANGLPQFKDAKRILVSKEELDYAEHDKVGRIRMQKKWWENVDLRTFTWNGTEGPAKKSFDLFGDGSIVLINIPGHTPGQVAVKVTGKDGKFFLYYADGGYTKDSWEKQIPSGVADDKDEQSLSLAWIRGMSLDPLCVESLPNHDPDVKEHVLTLEA